VKVPPENCILHICAIPLVTRFVRYIDPPSKSTALVVGVAG